MHSAGTRAAQLSLFGHLGLVCLAIAGAVCRADVITFVPPNDTAGSVFSADRNDAYDLWRGGVFHMSGDVTVQSVGIFHDLTNQVLNFRIAEIPAITTQVNVGHNVLRSGSRTVTTSGLEWLDFAISPLTLLAGHSYHLEFQFEGAANQNFFHNNDNIAFTQGSFTSIDGTQAGFIANFVIPAMRVNTGVTVSEVPEPSGIALLVSVIAGVGVAHRRRRLAR